MKFKIKDFFIAKIDSKINDFRQDLMILIGFGLLVCIYAAYNGFNFLEAEKRCTIKINATVIENKREVEVDSQGNSYTTHILVLVYKLGDMTFTKEVSGGYLVGESVVVMINPRNPKECIDLNQKHGIIMSFCIGISFILVCGLLLIFVSIYIRKKNNSEVHGRYLE